MMGMILVDPRKTSRASTQVLIFSPDGRTHRLVPPSKVRAVNPVEHADDVAYQACDKALEAYVKTHVMGDGSDSSSTGTSSLDEKARKRKKAAEMQAKKRVEKQSRRRNAKARPKTRARPERVR